MLWGGAKKKKNQKTKSLKVKMNEYNGSKEIRPSRRLSSEMEIRLKYLEVGPFYKMRKSSV